MVNTNMNGKELPSFRSCHIVLLNRGRKTVEDGKYYMYSFFPIHKLVLHSACDLFVVERGKKEHFKKMDVHR